MTDIDEVVEDIALAHGYDPVKARAYYLRTRKLKGRRVGSSKPPTKKPRRIEEDQVPMKSRSGARLLDYDGKGPGKATYSDGSVFDGNGWHAPKSKAAAAKTVGDAQRLNNAQKKLSRARRIARNIPNSAKKNAVLKRLNIVEQKLATAKSKQAKKPPPSKNRGRA